MEPVKIQANFIPKTGMFLFKVVNEEGKSVKVNLPCDQFLGMVKYLGQVALSYQQWLAQGAPSVPEVQCPTCKKDIEFHEFRNELSVKEFEISGMCQECQDSVFGED